MTSLPSFGATGSPGQPALPGGAPVPLGNALSPPAYLPGGERAQTPPGLMKLAAAMTERELERQVRAIPLIGVKAAGRVALVDEADFELVSAYRWYVWENVLPGGTVSGPYAIAKIPVVSGKKHASTSLRMHKLITGWALTDHINHDGLDNRRSNLRPASPSQNQANQRRQRPVGTSIYKGVRWQRDRRAWKAAISKNYKERYLGLYKDEVQAALAYDRAALEVFGEYAVLNFPGGANESR